MDIFEEKNIKPMLIGSENDPFDDPESIFELKLDGERCIAYLNREMTELRNKRNVRLLPKFPELSQLHRQVKKHTCILDGELIVAIQGRPVFEQVQKRSLMSNKIKIEFASKNIPASFVAYDILYLDGKQLVELPLMDRKKILAKVIHENGQLAISRYIEEHGIELYNLAKEQALEGIIAKKRNSFYYFGKKTKDWTKIKYLQDDDYVILGYIIKSPHITSLILGQYHNTQLEYKGHVTMGISRSDFDIIKMQPPLSQPPLHSFPKGNEQATWIAPKLVCKVAYMQKNNTGSLRQPVYKGLRDDKEPKECKA